MARQSKRKHVLVAENSQQNPGFRSSANNPPSWLGPDDKKEATPSPCAFCGNVPPEGSSFCPNCGRAVTAALLPQQGQSLTVLFTDIEDSTKLNETLGDEAWAEIINVHNEIVRDELHFTLGFEVKLTGDGFLIAFPDSANALRCAARVQDHATRLAEQRGSEWPVIMCMGLHRGDVILRPGGDILGRTVNMASRILGKSRGGTIFVSDALKKEVLPQLGEQYWASEGRRKIKGLRQSARLHRFLWQEFIEDEVSRGIPRPELLHSTDNVRDETMTVEALLSQPQPVDA